MLTLFPDSVRRAEAFAAMGVPRADVPRSGGRCEYHADRQHMGEVRDWPSDVENQNHGINTALRGRRLPTGVPPYSMSSTLGSPVSSLAWCLGQYSPSRSS